MMLVDPFLRPILPVADAQAEVFPPGTRLAVLLVTYNHEQYVREAISSILFQDISLDFEIVIADDKSTDETRSIIKDTLDASEFKNYRFLDYSQNRGITRNYERALYACDAEYIAVIEGDDVWTHTGKLRILLNHLHVHRECVAASANYYVNVIKECRYYPRVPIEERWSYIDARSLIGDNLIGNFSTIMYRAKSLRHLPKSLFSGETYDWLLNISLLKHGLIAFYHSPLSIYNVHGGGAWSGMNAVEQLRARISGLERCDRLTGEVFTEDFRALRARLEADVNGLLAREGPGSWGARSMGYFEARLAHEREVARLDALHATIRSAPFPLLSRVLHALHRRTPSWVISSVRGVLPGAVRRVVAKSMGYRK